MDWKLVGGVRTSWPPCVFRQEAKGCWCSAGFFLPVSNQFWALTVPGGSMWAGLQLNLYANSLRYTPGCALILGDHASRSNGRRLMCAHRMGYL